MTAHLPTERELAILEVLWDKGEATVREVHEVLSQDLPIVQNTVQAFLRILSNKGLVAFRKQGRSFVYRAIVEPDPTRSSLLGRVLDEVYGGAVDRLVAGALSLRALRAEELAELRRLVEQYNESAPGE